MRSSAPIWASPAPISASSKTARSVSSPTKATPGWSRRCGACLNACPVYRTIGGHAYGDTYQGPVGAIITPGLRGLEAWRALPDASSLCGACREVCPVRIDIPRMLLTLRGAATRAHPHPRSLAAAMRLYAWAATRPRLYRMVVRVGGWWLRRLSRDGWIRKAPGLAGGWTRTRDLRAPAVPNFQQRWQERQRQRRDSSPR